MLCRKVLSEIMSHYAYEPLDDITLDAITHNFQLKCPGPYTLEWDPKDARPQYAGIRIKFTDLNEKLLWTLRYS